MTNLGKSISISIALSAALISSSALAAPAIVTPTVYASSSVSGGALCFVLNTSTKPVTVRAEVVNGATGAILGAFSGEILPGTNRGPQVSAPSGGQTYCRVSGISKNKARVTHCALSPGNTKCESTVTVP